MLSSYYIAIYLLYGPRFFSSDTVNSADTRGATNPQLDTSQLANALVRGYTREDKGPFGLGGQSCSHVTSYVIS